MAGFLYAFEQGRLTRESLAAMGFPHASMAGLPGGGCSVGPANGQPCRVFSLGSPPTPGGKSPRVGYFPDDQTWVSCEDGAWWLGWENARPPTPQDLRKRTTLRTQHVQLGDQNCWDISVIRAADGYPGVPTVNHFNADGTVALDHVEPQYASIWKGVSDFWDASLNGGTITELTGWTLVLDLLAMTYRLSSWEIAALKLANAGCITRILCAALDMEPAEV